ncbi:MAG: MltA domain-containing protein [Bacteriovoracaceae bacterium]
MKFIFLNILLVFSVAYAQEVTPTQRTYETIQFDDDLDFENVELAIARQLRSYDRIGLKGTIRFGTKVYPKSIMRDSLLHFQKLTQKAKECLKLKNERQTCYDRFNASMNKDFAIYKTTPAKGESGYGKPQWTKFTAYYSPDFHGSRTPTERFNKAIYRLPDNDIDRNQSRVDIDYHGALAGKGLELFYVEESFYDLYLLHVQGGGRIHVYGEDGKEEIKYLSYAGKNDLSFKMVYHYFVDNGLLPKNQATVPNQRKYLEENPHMEPAVFSICPSYIYFRESDEEPVGVNNIPLTEGRSVAIDRRIYKTFGILNFIRAKKAITDEADGKVRKVPFSRFFIAQDTGGAIRGNARCDLYMGYGKEAETTAYSLDDLGEQYMLVKKI